MPLLGGQKKAGSRGHRKAGAASTSSKPNNEHRVVKKATNGTSATPTLPPPAQPQENRHWTQVPPPPPPTSMIPSRQELVFHTQLAHGSATKDIKDFSNVKELYAKIAVVFDIPTTDVCVWCACLCLPMYLCVCLFCERLINVWAEKYSQNSLLEFWPSDHFLGILTLI